MAHGRQAYSVLIVDPLPTVRLALRWALEEVPGIRIVGEAGTGAEAIALASETVPDLVLMEIDLPDHDGLAVAAELRTAAPPPAILVLTLRNSPAWIRRARAAGANAVLEKGIGWEALLNAVRISLADRAARNGHQEHA